MLLLQFSLEFILFWSKSSFMDGLKKLRWKPKLRWKWSWKPKGVSSKWVIALDVIILCNYILFKTRKNFFFVFCLKKTTKNESFPYELKFPWKKQYWENQNCLKSERIKILQEFFSCCYCFFFFFWKPKTLCNLYLRGFREHEKILFSHQWG